LEHCTRQSAARSPSPEPRPFQLVAHIGFLNGEVLGDIEKLFIGLDRDTRCRRSGYAVTDGVLGPPATNVVMMTNVIGVYAGGDLRGLIEVYPFAPNPHVEAALVVEKDWRQRGLGWLLLRAGLQVAGATEAKSLRLLFARNNWPMRKLAEKAHARFDLMLGNICADIPVRHFERSREGDTAHLELD